MGEYRLANRHVVHDIKPNAWLTLSEIIAKSSNIGILKAARRLNKEQLETYTRQFGFGERTGIDLPYERVGSLRGIRKWDDYTIASVPFGQGISVTPMQMLNAINVIATKGILLQPYVTRQIIDKDGSLLEQFSSPADSSRHFRGNCTSNDTNACWCDRSRRRTASACRRIYCCWQNWHSTESGTRKRDTSRAKWSPLLQDFFRRRTRYSRLLLLLMNRRTPRSAAMSPHQCSKRLRVKRCAI